MPPDEVLELFAVDPTAYALVAILGMLFGSFANVCIYRWPPSDRHPRGLSVVTPGSHCFSCGAPVNWHDNIPILSYFVLRGRCRGCGVSFSPRYVLVEALMAMLFVAAYHATVGLSLEPLPVRVLGFLVLAALLFVLVVISFIDIDHKLILDKITYPAIPILYGLGLLLPGSDPWRGIIGAAVGYGLVRLVSDGYYHLTGREGLGYGDGKLLAIVGALYGWEGVIAALFIGSLAGSSIGIAAILVVRARSDNDEQSARSRITTEQPGTSELEPGSPGHDPDGSDHEHDLDRPERDDLVPLRHVALPFGPFLAAGAVAYAFAQPWLRIGLAGLWTWDPSVM